MERTLYLNENKWLIVKRDGPSLWIKERHKAGQRVPVRLIGQVVIRGNITIESGVITLLAEHGIPVSFLTRRGDITATTLLLDNSYTVLRERVERLYQSENGTFRVSQWLTARRQNLQRNLLKTLVPDKARVIEQKGLREKDYQSYLKILLFELAEKGQPDAVSGILQGFFHELILAKVIEVELDPHTGFIHRYKNFAFIQDLSYILEAERDRQLIQFFKSRSKERFMESESGHWIVNSEGMKNLIVRFENHKKRISGYTDILLRDFFGILREVWL